MLSCFLPVPRRGQGHREAALALAYLFHCSLDSSLFRLHFRKGVCPLVSLRGPQHRRSCLQPSEHRECSPVGPRAHLSPRQPLAQEACAHNNNSSYRFYSLHSVPGPVQRTLSIFHAQSSQPLSEWGFCREETETPGIT